MGVVKTKSGCTGLVFIALICMAIGAIITFWLGYGCDSYYFNKAVFCNDNQDVIWKMYDAKQDEMEWYYYQCLDLEQEINSYKILFDDCNKRNDKRMGLSK